MSEKTIQVNVHPRVDDAADEARDLVAVEVEPLLGERRAQERADLVADIGLVELRPRLEGGVELWVELHADCFGFDHWFPHKTGGRLASCGVYSSFVNVIG